MGAGMEESNARIARDALAERPPELFADGAFRSGTFRAPI